MVRFDGTIPPGGEGKITIKVKTRGYKGAIQKTARIFSNDPEKRIETIAIRAFVKVPIDIFPEYVILEGNEGQVLTQAVIITAQEKRPLKLEPMPFALAEKVTYRLKVIKPGRVFNILFTNRSPSKGSFRGSLKIKTNYPEKPVITIPLRAKFHSTAGPEKAG